MRLLFTSSPGVGHLLPILAVAIAARDAGHQVAVGCGASLERMVVRAGLRHVDLGLATIREVEPLIPELANVAGPGRAVLMFREAFGRLLAGPMADDVLAFASSWRPVVVVHEDLELGGWIAAERLGIPHVTIQAAAWRPDKRASVVSNLDAIRVRLGLPSEPVLAGRDGRLWFTTRPRAMRDPAKPMPAVLRELRPEADDRFGAEIAEMPAWLAAPAGRPRIAVTLGTVNAHRTDLIRPVLEGLAEEDFEVIVALGADPATLGSVPQNTRVERYVPMSQLIPRSALVVHHAGSGTTLSALLAGRPAILLPIAADQPENAAGCAAAGTGVVLDVADFTAEAVRSTALTILTEPRFADRARSVAAEIAAMPDAAAALAEIVAIA